MTMTPREFSRENSTDVFRLPNGRVVLHKTLKRLLPDIETALFFGKVYNLGPDQLADLLRITHRTTLVEALTGGEHSTELQDYLIDISEQLPESVYTPTFTEHPETPPPSELLVQLWEAAQIRLAKSIQEVADELSATLDRLPSREGQMVFQHMQQMNVQRNTIGRYGATIQHAELSRVLVILDVSGSMSEQTIRTIVDDVVALGYNANATLAIVSNSTFEWAPGTYSSNTVLQHAEFGATRYETLAPLFQQRDWDVVVTIADYDSSRNAKSYLRDFTDTQIGRVLDLSLVNRPTFLAECVGQFADSIQPLLMGVHRYPL